MKIITEQEYKNLFPNTLNINLAASKGLAKDGNLTDYYYVASLYYHYLEIYLSNILPIKEYENNLSSIPNVRKVPDSEKDIYQLLSTNDYFYIRNTLFVENLSIEEISMLTNSDPTSPKQEILDLIARTYPKVITLTDKLGEEFIIAYGPNQPDYMKPNSSLIIGIRFAEEDDKLYPSDDAWFEDYISRRAKITDIEKQAEQEFSTKLNHGCCVVEYYNDSIKKESSITLTQ